MFESVLLGKIHPQIAIPYKHKALSIPEGRKDYIMTTTIDLTRMSYDELVSTIREKISPHVSDRDDTYLPEAFRDVRFWHPAVPELKELVRCHNPDNLDQFCSYLDEAYAHLKPEEAVRMTFNEHDIDAYLEPRNLDNMLKPGLAGIYEFIFDLSVYDQTPTHNLISPVFRTLHEAYGIRYKSRPNPSGRCMAQLIAILRRDDKVIVSDDTLSELREKYEHSVYNLGYDLDGMIRGWKHLLVSDLVYELEQFVREIGGIDDSVGEALYDLCRRADLGDAWQQSWDNALEKYDYDHETAFSKSKTLQKLVKKACEKLGVTPPRLI